jgi:hypothetical protein
LDGLELKSALIVDDDDDFASEGTRVSRNEDEALANVEDEEGI